MANVVEVKISGLDRISDALEHAPLRVAKRIMRNALVGAGRIWKSAIVSLVRRGPHHPPGGGATEYGVLANNVSISTSVKSDLEGRVRVGFSSKFPWATWLERGTGPRSRRKPGLTRAQSRTQARSNQMPAFPYMAQAGQAGSRDVLDRFTEGVGQALGEEYGK